ncbi:acyl carrier protein [Nocardia yunnanensis]|uniref:Acyl carrier protein n=1 Tax=Nocardia yunnanensis TaxID=2382165 RepID=A0A386ZBF4_9NOCA|nr:acyl carrier protein [Nocardia yunnanensis]AYF73829.1 acyl carrier protein [Nocardia yunnanensis]
MTIDNAVAAANSKHRPAPPDRPADAIATGEQVADRVRQIVAAMAPRPVTPLEADLRLIDDLGYDSLRLMELTVVLERSFALPRYRPEQLLGVLRVGQVVDLITRTLAGA